MKKTSMKKISTLFMSSAAFLCLPALAHTGHAPHSDSLIIDLAAGFIHPFTGLDHLAALILLGVILSRNSLAKAGQGFAIAMVSFFAALMLGAFVPVMAQTAEWVALGSVVVFAWVAFKKMALSVGLMGMAVMAMAGHGIAHGAELAASTAINPLILLSFAAGSTLAASTITLVTGWVSRRVHLTRPTLQ